MIREPNTSRTRALGLGVVAGLRSMLAPALLSRAASRGELGSIEETPFAVLASPRATQILALLAIGEAIADKTPVVPSRASTPVLLQRAVNGAVVGGALSRQGFRQATAGRPGIPGLVPALVEDAFAVGLGLLSLRGVSR
jgi:uncharacterized membrane protein